MLVKILENREINKLKKKFDFYRVLEIQSNNLYSIEIFNKNGLIRSFANSKSEALKLALSKI